MESKNFFTRLYRDIFNSVMQIVLTAKFRFFLEITWNIVHEVKILAQFESLKLGRGVVETFHPILDVKFLVEERINEHNEYVILLLPYYLEEMLYLKLI